MEPSDKFNSLLDKFNRYVGLEIREPRSFTTDVDPVRAAIEQDAWQAGCLRVHIVRPNRPCGGPKNDKRLQVHVDASRRITGFKIG